MDKSQILTAILVGILVLGIAVYRLLWVGSSSAAAIGLRKFPKSPGKLGQWLLGRRARSSTDEPTKPKSESGGRQ